MLDWFKEFLKKVMVTPATRVSDNLSGPFIFAFLLVFWEIPVHLIFSDAPARIDNINLLLRTNLSLPFDLHPSRFTIIVLAWIFWVFVFPVIGPFVHRFRSWIIDEAKAKNMYEAYAGIKKQNNELISQNSDLLAKSNAFDNYKNNLLDKIKTNKDNFNYIFLLHDIARQENITFSTDESEFFNKFLKTQDAQTLTAIVNDEVRDLLDQEHKLRFTLAIMVQMKRMYDQLSEAVK